MVKSHLGTILTETERCWMFATAWLQFCTLPTNLFPTHYIESQELCWSKWNEAFSFRHNHLWCMYLVSIPRVQKVERSTLTKKLHFCDLRYQGRRRNEMKWNDGLKLQVVEGTVNWRAGVLPIGVKISVTRSGDLLDFGQLLYAFGNT